VIQERLGERYGCAVALYNLGCVACEQGDITASVKYHTESLQMKRAENDQPGIAAGLAGLGNVAYIQGDYQKARSLLEESICLYRRIDLVDWAGYSEMTLGLVEYASGSLERSLSLLRNNLKYWEETNEKRSMVCAHGAIGNVLLEMHQDDAARVEFDACIALNREVEDRSSQVTCYIGLARLAQREGQPLEALRHCRQGLQILAETVERHTVAMVLLRIAEILASLVSGKEVRALLDASDAIYATMGCMRPPMLDPIYLRLRAFSGDTTARGHGSEAQYFSYHAIVACALHALSEDSLKSLSRDAKIRLE
jgi:tetratricopeptide (TPR) repeat protein